MTFKDAWEIVGGLSTPSKMPGYAHSIHVSKCQTGKKLTKVAGSVCEQCYAMRGHYLFGGPQKAMMRRWRKLKHPRWIEAMSLLIKSLDCRYFRIHDAGDFQGVWHIKNWANVAKNCLDVKFWAPTREFSMVSEYLRQNQLPANLVIRLSALMIDGPLPTALAKRLGVQVSGVSRKQWNCPSHETDNKCGTCRKCWDKNEFEIVYKKH